MFVTHRLADVRYLSSTYAVRTPDGKIELQKENQTLNLVNTKLLVINNGKVVFDGTDEQLWSAKDEFLLEFTHHDEKL